MTRDELEAMTKDELVAYADDHDIEVSHSWVKSDIVSAILKGQQTDRQPEARANTTRRTTMTDTDTTPATTRRPTAAERATQMNLYTEERRKLKQAEEDRRTFIALIDELEAKANQVADEESREALLTCVDNMRAKAEEERVKAEEEEKRRADETAAAQPQAAE
jgi:hypothetical protein